MRGRVSLILGLALLSGQACWPGQPPPAKGKSKEKAVDKDKEAVPEAEKALLRATRRVQKIYLDDIEKIASWAATNGLKEDAERLLATMVKVDPEYPAIKKLQAAVAKVEPQDDAKKLADLKQTFSRRVDAVNEKHARRLFDLATNCMKVGLFTRAYHLVKSVLDFDPDHRRAREVLSYAWDSTTRTWITKWEAEMKKKNVLTDEGWVKKEDKKKWDQGKREYEGKWIPKDEEERLRKRNNYNPFRVETEHFQVLTNLGRPRALEFGLRLEDFYRQFFEFFIGFYDQVAGAKLLFNQAKVKAKHKVFLFPSRVDYLDFVRAEKGNNELLVRSAGFWDGADRCSYFYWTENPAETLNTLYHEVTHQLFGETKETSGQSSGNTWIVEGIAVYMETWAKVDGRWRPGYRIDAQEMGVARAVLSQNPDWSLARFVAQGHKEFHDPKVRGANYALAGALAHFFLHYDEEIYREHFILLLRDHYAGKLKGDSLETYIRPEGAAVPEALIEKQFKEYMGQLKRPGSEADAPAEAAKTK